MSTAYQIVVCGSIVPDPLQTLEPVASPVNPERGYARSLPRRHRRITFSGKLSL
jgi:electron transfer flavoprotein beta subunit